MGRPLIEREPDRLQDLGLTLDRLLVQPLDHDIALAIFEDLDSCLRAKEVEATTPVDLEEGDRDPHLKVALLDRLEHLVDRELFYADHRVGFPRACLAVGYEGDAGSLEDFVNNRLDSEAEHVLCAFALVEDVVKDKLVRLNVLCYPIDLVLLAQDLYLGVGSAHAIVLALLELLRKDRPLADADTQLERENGCVLLELLDLEALLYDHCLELDVAQPPLKVVLELLVELLLSLLLHLGPALLPLLLDLLDFLQQALLRVDRHLGQPEVLTEPIEALVLSAEGAKVVLLKLSDGLVLGKLLQPLFLLVLR